MCLLLCLLESIALCGMSESKVDVYFSENQGENALTNPLKQMWHKCWFAKSLVVYKDISYVFYDYRMVLKIL